MKRLLSLFVILSLAAIARPAMAHFLWLQSDAESKPAKVQLWFSETTVPGEATILDNVSQAKVWIPQADGSQQAVKLEKQVNGDVGGWIATVAEEPSAIEATCDYGVITRGETFLLQYHARHLGAKGLDAAAKSTSKPLPLDIVTRRDGKSLVFEVRFDGKPAADAQLMVIAPNNEEREVKLDTAGTARIEDAAPGDYALRAREELKTPGERDGKKYDLIRHYTTVTFRLPGQAGEQAAAPKAHTIPVATTATPDANGPTAAELLQKARDARAVWENFPGFKAEVEARIDGKVEHGTISVDNEGTTAVSFNDDKIKSWAEQQAGSLVQHRLPSGFGEEKPEYADEDTNHPLGRLVKIGDAGFGSVYRIRDNQVTEVNRTAGPMKFTISVLESEKNSDGKYLPRVFSITNWDGKSGDIKSSSAVINTWTQVGKFDLPAHILEVTTTPGDRQVRELTFSNYKLREKK
jgi:hypothetical protein